MESVRTRPGLRRWLWTPSLVLVLTTGAGALLAGAVAPGEAAPEKAPAWTLTLFSGEVLRSADLQGKVVIIRFLASW